MSVLYVGFRIDRWVRDKSRAFLYCMYRRWVSEKRQLRAGGSIC
jgi:hypothetical protein